MADAFDVIVIGAGLLGLSTAMALLAERPALRVAVLTASPTGSAVHPDCVRATAPAGGRFFAYL